MERTGNAISVAYTTLENGVGMQIPGWYVMHFGVPLGRPHESEFKAIDSARVYASDLASCVRSI